jgi:hypothetical protein
MPDLTLDQVREAGRFAKHDDGYEYHPDNVDGFWGPWVEFINDGDAGDPVWDECSASEEDMPLTGWHHPTGCDCEFCA